MVGPLGALGSLELELLLETAVVVVERRRHHQSVLLTDLAQLGIAHLCKYDETNEKSSALEGKSYHLGIRHGTPWPLPRGAAC